MSDPGLAEDIRKAIAAVERNDTRFSSRLDGFERTLNDHALRLGRPGPSFGHDGGDLERKSATEMCRVRYGERHPKIDGVAKEYQPSTDEIDEALAAQRGFHHTIIHGSAATCDPFVQKSLSAFSFGPGGGILLPPQRAQQVLSCIVLPSSLGGLFNSIATSAPAVEFLIENPRMGLGSWACEGSCAFANNPGPDLSEGMGTLLIKPETIRFIACATRDFVEDAAGNAENWIIGKISEGMAATINNALILGDGNGKPMGIFHPRSGIPVVLTNPNTPAGTLTWQDLVMLKWEIPYQWQQGASYLMNQRTFAQLMTMTDAMQRPIWGQMPGEEPGFQLAGSPIHIVTQMPDINPGSTPVAFGNWERAYTIVWRKAVTVQVDPFSANFCILYKAEARVGGGLTCANAARLLQVR